MIGKLHGRKIRVRRKRKVRTIWALSRSSKIPISIEFLRAHKASVRDAAKKPAKQGPKSDDLPKAIYPPRLIISESHGKGGWKLRNRVRRPVLSYISFSSF